MKTQKIVLAAIIIATILTQSCTKEYSRIDGIGPISTETLMLQDFSGIDMDGADEVIISFGTEQKVEVTGHPNIINRIKTDVTNGIWYMELEHGNYGLYELTYYITLPTIEKISNTGSANVTIVDPMVQNYMEVILNGSGSLFGFPLQAESCQVDITGSGNCEITANQHLDVSIDGSGSVFYKGNPTIMEDISGSGRVTDAN
jgi:hypothetical protein